MKILFISYLFDPDKRVAAKRMSYWAQNFKNHIEDAEVELITTEKEPNRQGLDKVYITEEVSTPLLGYLIKDEGVSWAKAVKKILLELDLKTYGYIVFSGTPFMQFGLTGFIKARSRAKVILDYRDPFAVNPRFNNSKLKIWIKKYFERSFNQKADLIISVNQYCVELLEGYEQNPEKFAVIRNGFDERETESIGQSLQVEKDEFSFIYAGTILKDRDPTNLLKVIEKKHGIKLIQVGRESDFLKKSPALVELGMQPYRETLKLISESSMGLIVTIGEPYESTTKIYDYIAMKRPVFVITSGEINTGAIADELEGYPSIWCINKTSEIEKALDSAKEISIPENLNVESYSRKESLKELINHLRNLERR